MSAVQMRTEPLKHSLGPLHDDTRVSSVLPQTSCPFVSASANHSLLIQAMTLLHSLHVEAKPWRTYYFTLSLQTMQSTMPVNQIMIIC
eukprot:1144997-Pelagomonas_calceolata.AAC.3